MAARCGAESGLAEPHIAPRVISRVIGRTCDGAVSGPACHANLPTNGGAGTNEDTVWVVRAADFLPYEDPVRQFKFEDVLSGTLQVRLQCCAYSAFFCDRWPKSVARISGTGLTAPTWA